MKEYAETFYKSKTWQMTRKAYLSKAGQLCEECLRKGIISPATEVHHKIHITPNNISDPNITLNWDNLEALCHKCHMNRHKKDTMRYSTDKYGRVSPHIDIEKR